jgi:hypothetical protein
MYAVLFNAPYGTVQTQNQFQGVFTTRDKALAHVRKWKDLRLIPGYVATVTRIGVDDDTALEKVAEIEM